MSTEPKFLVSLLNTKDIPTFLKVDKSIFKTEDGKNAYSFINEYFSSYKELPTIEVFKEKHPSFPYNTEFNNPEFFYRELQSQSTKLELAKMLQEASAYFNKEAPDVIISNLRNKLGNLSNQKSIEKVIDIRESIEQRYDDLLNRQSNEKKEKIYTLGHPYLDKLGTIEKGSVNIILARFGVGKSWMGLYLAYKYWRRGLNPLFISIEMPSRQVEERLDSIISGVSYARVKDGTLYPEELQKFKKYVKDMKEDESKSRLNIAAPSRCSVNKVRELAIEYKAGAVFIDYVQIMDDTVKQKEKRFALSNIGNDLRALAKELEIPIFIIAQANRVAIDEVPRGEHIKESDDLGANADTIISLYQSQELKDQRKLEIHLTKFRSGEEGYVSIDSCMNTMNYMDIKNPFFIKEGDQ